MKNENKKFEFDIKNLSIENVDLINKNNYNPKELDTKEYKQIVRSIDINGFAQPIIVRDNPDKTSAYKYIIIDGQNRYLAAKELGYTEIPIYNAGDISDKDAKAFTLWAQTQVPFNEIDLSHLVVELDEASVALPYTEAEIADFRHMSEFNFDNFDDDEDDFGDMEVKTFKVTLSDEAYQIVTKAVKKVQDENDCSEARALELMSIEFLNAPKGTTGLGQA